MIAVRRNFGEFFDIFYPNMIKIEQTCYPHPILYVFWKFNNFKKCSIKQTHALHVLMLKEVLTFMSKTNTKVSGLASLPPLFLFNASNFHCQFFLRPSSPLYFSLLRFYNPITLHSFPLIPTTLAQPLEEEVTHVTSSV